jgi:hypothetical protein
MSDFWRGTLVGAGGGDGGIVLSHASLAKNSRFINQRSINLRKIFFQPDARLTSCRTPIYVSTRILPRRTRVDWSDNILADMLSEVWWCSCFAGLNSAPSRTRISFDPWLITEPELNIWIIASEDFTNWFRIISQKQHSNVIEANKGAPNRGRIHSYTKLCFGSILRIRMAFNWSQ